MSTPQPNPVPRQDASRRDTTPGLPPAFAATVVNNESGSFLGIADLSSGQVQPLGPAEANSARVPRAPLWAPDGKRLIFHVEDALMSWSAGKDPVQLVKGIAADAPTPYAFSPDSSSLAVALPDAVLVLRFAPAAGENSSSKSTLPSGCRPVDLFWAADGNQLFALCTPDDAKLVSQLLRFDRLGGFSSKVNARDVTRLLGWRGGTVLGTRSTGSGDEIGTVSMTGEFQRLRATENNEVVIHYASGPDLVVLQKETEDTGDPVVLQLAAPNQPGARRWLGKFPMLADLALSNDGRWAMFVDRQGHSDELGGDVYLAQVGAGEAKLVLRVKPGTRSYSFPAPQ